MRVCVDLTPLEMLDRHGGFGRYAQYLLREMIALEDAEPSGLELTAVLSSLGPVLDAREALDGARHLGPEIRSWRHRMQRRVRLRAPLRRAHIDLFHSIVPWAQPIASGALLVVTAHDLVPIVVPEPGPGQRLFAAPRRALQWRRYAMPDHLIAISQNTKSDLVRELRIDPRHISVVHHGVDCSHFRSESEAGERAAVRKRHGLPEKWIICVSSDHYRKNHRVLLDAWYRVADRIDEGLVFVGRALYEDTFASIAREVGRRGLEKRFRWLDDIDDAELPALYRGATVCVAPSLYEGFGMTLLEAMACGTAVVAAENGAYEEVGADAARYFPVHDVAALADHIVDLVSDERARAELVARGHERARAMSWTATAKQTLAVYHQLLRER